MPAATIVAAWMSADAGVGPSIASGSQSWNGNWADLPRTPMTSNESRSDRSHGSGGAMQAAVCVTVSTQTPPVCDQKSTTLSRPVEPAPALRPTTPRTNPMSATRVTMKALYAARRADFLRDQWPMSR